MKYQTLRQTLSQLNDSVAGRGRKGLTTERPIKLGDVIAVTHIEDLGFTDNYIRTFAGALVNHSDNPNAHYQQRSQGVWIIYAIERIEAGQEILVEYGTGPIEAGVHEMGKRQAADFVP